MAGKIGKSSSCYLAHVGGTKVGPRGMQQSVEHGARGKPTKKTREKETKSREAIVCSKCIGESA